MTFRQARQWLLVMVLTLKLEILGQQHGLSPPPTAPLGFKVEVEYLVRLRSSTLTVVSSEASWVSQI